MKLIVGTRLGPYRILAPLGAGGMGEVYTAEDTRLGRTVAIKVLPSHLSSDPKRRERFELEARTISRLNHPRICTLHDIGRHEETDFIVMEHLEGETLVERLAKGALPLEQALRYGIEIAEALHQAHRAGVVHRDLKPGNIMITRQGIKLLDFGLARLVEPAPEASAASDVTATLAQGPLTEEGAIVGTIAYMAPEQLEGADADARADLFALGGVLYEMVTGKRAFGGKSRAALISAVMTSEPQPVTELQPVSPPMLDHLLGKCLAKDPETRWQSASDLASGLEWIVAAGGGESGAAPVSSAGRERAVWGLAGLVAGAVVTALVLVAVKAPSGPTAPVHFTVQIPPDQELVLQRFAIGKPPSNPLAISPDGTRLVYAASTGGGASMLYLRDLDRLDATPLPGTEGGRDPFFSPDGQWVGFRTADTLRRVSLEGGPALKITDAHPAGNVASWGSDDRIVYETGGAELQQVPAGGGQPRSITTHTGAPHLGPQVLPGGQGVLFTGWNQGWELAMVPPEGGEPQFFAVPGQVQWGRYLPTGHLVYRTADGLMAAPFDPGQRRLEGEPVSVLGDVATHVTVSDTGTLAYVSQDRPLALGLVWVDREGTETPLLEDNHSYHFPRVSPDGTRVAFDAVGVGDIWIFEPLRGTRSRLAFDGVVAQTTWTGDGSRITFSGSDDDIYWVDVDGGGTAELLLAREHAQGPMSWSPDGHSLLYTEIHPETSRDIWILPVEDGRGGDPVPYLVTPADEGAAKFSPDGRWVAYRSAESGEHQIYVRPFPGPGERFIVSAGGGTEPVWSADGTELFYRQGDALMAVATTLGDDFQATRPRLLFRGAFTVDPIGHPLYDAHPDGQRFLMVRETEAQSPPQIKVVLNWFEELERLVPTR